MEAKTQSCRNCQQNFTIEPDDFSLYQKLQVPAPEMCQDCRQEKRIIFRNFKTLYKRPSSKSGVSMITMYSPDVPFPVYTHDEWWADDWDAKSYGRDFDFNRPFFEQFQELLNVVPRQPSMVVRSDECEYSNSVYDSKRCYLIAGGIDIENCDYGHIVYESRDCIDNLYIRKCELCYECIDCINCNRLLYSQDCEDCMDSIGLYNCRGCMNCFGCSGLRQKSYCIFNEQVTKEEYQQFINEHPIADPATHELIRQKQFDFNRILPQRHMQGSHNVNVAGNHIWNGKNLRYCFDVKNSEDSQFVFTSRNFKDCHDVSFSPDVEESYYVLTAPKSARIFFSHFCNASHDIWYSDSVFSSSELFGCAGLRSSEYCIFNKQYSKEEYLALKTKIIEHMKSTGEWGKWFPVSLSPFAYNESIVNEYTPRTKEEALALGYRWKDNIPTTRGQENNDPDLLKRIMKCETCAKNYRFIDRELVFYKKLNLPLPSQCFNCRHQRRMDLRLPRKLWKRECAHCKKEIETSYSPDRPEIVYCEKCYQKEVL